MIAVKYKTLQMNDSSSVQWIEKTHSGVSLLPEGFDEFISQEDLDSLIQNNQASYDLYKTEQADLSTSLSEVAKFKYLREAWQEIADNLAVKNAAKGITAAGKSKEVADAFKDVMFYLSVNTPTEALAALGAITPIPTFLDQAKIDELSAEFSSILSELW